MMALPDPNKQTFPIIQNPTQFLASPNCPSPTKTTDSITLALKHPAIQLPALVHSGGGGDGHKETTQQNATAVTLPKVKKTIQMKKAAVQVSYMRGNRIPENFREVPADPMPYQCRLFRSTTKVKPVPVTKRHRDMFSSADRSESGPLAMTKNMPFYTKPFLWQAKEKAGNQTETTSLPSRFLEEEENLREVRGQKRKHGVPSHRQGYNDLYVGGNTPHIAQKFDYKSEADNLRHMVLPENAQELYMGRGIRLPEDHSINRRKHEWKANIDADYALPTSAPVVATEPSITTAAATTTTAKEFDSTTATRPDVQSTTKTRYTASHPQPKATRSHSITHHNDADSRSSVASERSVASRKPERRKSKAEGARQSSDASRRNSDASRRNSIASQRGVNAGKGNTEQPNREGEKVAEHLQEPVKPEVIDSAADEVDMERDEDKLVADVQTIPEESKEEGDTAEIVQENRPDSETEMEAQEEDSSGLGLLRGSASPKGAPTTNPLTSIDITLHVSASQKEELAERFHKLDSNKDGHITFQELSSVLPESLTKTQKKFIKEVYEVVSSNTFFGLEEFVGVTCLVEMLSNLPDPVKDSYDAIDFAKVQQSIEQFVMMFSSVDRQQTGAISIPSLLEVLSMATDRDLVSDHNLTGQILTAIGKNLSSTIDKVEFLALLPYFLQLR